VLLSKINFNAGQPKVITVLKIIILYCMKNIQRMPLLENGRKIYTCFLIVAILSGGPAAIAQDKDEAEIRNLLNEQIIAWNKGDIQSFMKGYWQSDSLIFVGKNGPKYGYKTTLENYRKSYPDTSTMGKLSFRLLEVKRLSEIYFSVLGNWYLKRSIGDIQGYFTILIKKIQGKWLIVMDHSS
jgi:ketosteroid isomerase-like protein